MPRCRIALARGAESPGFPFVSRFKELAGSVTYAAEVSPNGALANPRLSIVDSAGLTVAENDDDRRKFWAGVFGDEEFMAFFASKMQENPNWVLALAFVDGGLDVDDEVRARHGADDAGREQDAVVVLHVLLLGKPE